LTVLSAIPIFNSSTCSFWCDTTSKAFEKPKQRGQPVSFRQKNL